MSDCRPLVSVILPVLNGEKSLVIALKSIVDQTYDNWELFVLDDGSIDKSVTIINDIQDHRVFPILPNHDRGLALRLNQGIHMANGKYIARMDADDISFPERLARQVEFLEAHPDVDLVGTRILVFRDDGSVIGHPFFAESHDAICARPWNGFPLPHPTWMGRADWFRRHQYAVPEYKRAEDQELLLRTHEVSTFACLPDVLLAYRQGPFCLKKTLVGRANLLKAQIHCLLRSSKYLMIFKSLVIFGIKCVVDFFASLPMLDALYFWRMSAKPATKDVIIFKKIYNKYSI
ncbi:glycosyltransferase family 2 protein [Desulfomicrobium escambiense]|uniref:glycosyltransferase family 2 protein n=1 Tax=Desulfomicrobium escambiense TaxID=29503 RepID=UPI0012ECAE0B|nr:glycosyltransferase family 2 protein [Desulfomicrobium escambiense]